MSDNPKTTTPVPGIWSKSLDEMIVAISDVLRHKTTSERREWVPDWETLNAAREYLKREASR